MDFIVKTVSTIYWTQGEKMISNPESRLATWRRCGLFLRWQSLLLYVATSKCHLTASTSDLCHASQITRLPWEVAAVCPDITYCVPTPPATDLTASRALCLPCTQDSTVTWGHQHYSGELALCLGTTGLSVTSTLSWLPQKFLVSWHKKMRSAREHSWGQGW